MQIKMTQEAISLFRNILREIPKSEKIYVYNFGDFMIEKIASKLGFNVCSSGADIFSIAVGDYVIGIEDEDLHVLDSEYQNIFDEWEKNDLSLLCQVMFVKRTLGFYRRRNDYELEMWNNYAEGNHDYRKTTEEKLRKTIDFKLSEFTRCGFCDYLKNKRGRGVGIFAFSENKQQVEPADCMFNIVHTLNASNAQERKKAVLEAFSCDSNILYSDKQIEWLSEYYCGKLEGNSRGDIYIYSSVAGIDRHFAEKRVSVAGYELSLLSAEDKINRKTQITVEECKVSMVNYYKQFYMAAKVNYSTGGDFGLVFKADGKAFGFASFNSMLTTDELIYETSDFVILSNAEPRLSKLLIMLLKTKEVRSLVARKYINYYDGLKTTVYTKSSVSMKYRGVFDLARKEEGKLIYTAKFEDKSIKEIYRLWIDKYQTPKQ